MGHNPTIQPRRLSCGDCREGDSGKFISRFQLKENHRYVKRTN